MSYIIGKRNKEQIPQPQFLPILTKASKSNPSNQSMNYLNQRANSAMKSQKHNSFKINTSQLAQKPIYTRQGSPANEDISFESTNGSCQRKTKYSMHQGGNKVDAHGRMTALLTRQYLITRKQRNLKIEQQSNYNSILPLQSGVKKEFLDKSQKITQINHERRQIKINKGNNRIRNYDELYLSQYSHEDLDSKKSHLRLFNMECRKESIQKSLEYQNILEGHEVTAYYRTKMIDWIIKVITAFKKSNVVTIFHAISILDKMFATTQQLGIRMGLNDLHLVGLTSILISSKFNDVYPIKLDSLVKDAGHNKFEKEVIIIAEQNILRTLGYNLSIPNVHETASLVLRKCIHSYYLQDLDRTEIEELQSILDFICLVVIHKLSFSIMDHELLVTSVILSALLLKKEECKLSQTQQLPFNEKQSSCLKKDMESIYERILTKFKLENNIHDQHLCYKLLIPKILTLVKKIQKDKFKFKAISVYIPKQLKPIYQNNETTCTSDEVK